MTAAGPNSHLVSRRRLVAGCFPCQVNCPELGIRTGLFQPRLFIYMPIVSPIARARRVANARPRPQAIPALPSPEGRRFYEIRGDRSC